MKIAIFIPKIAAGGAERVFVTLANYWADIGFDITVVTISCEEPFYAINEKVHIVTLPIKMGNGKIKAIIACYKIIIELRRYLKYNSPNALISYITPNNVLVIFASLGLKIPVIISERSNPLLSKKIAKEWLWLRNRVYRYASSLVVQTNESKEIFASFGLRLPNMEVIHNPIGKDFSSRFALHKEKIILSVGRFTEEKGHEKIIEAFSKINENDWVLHIVGDGHLRTQLEELILKLGIEKKVVLFGQLKNLDLVEKYSKASVFVLASQYEGFPNALCEAMAMGCAVISFRCKTGPEELITHYENGILVEVGDINELSQQIRKCIGDDILREKLSTNAQNIRHTLGLPKIASQWEKLIEASKI